VILFCECNNCFKVRRVGVCMGKDNLIKIIGDFPSLFFEGGVDGKVADVHWVYRDMIDALEDSGWFRAAVGFKSGIYAHKGNSYVLKIMGMGMGEAPHYYCGKGFYNAHEKMMLQSLESLGFDWGPKVLGTQETINILQHYGVSEEQATLRSVNHDVLLVERIAGIPLGRFTGKDDEVLNTVFNIERPVEIASALYEFKQKVVKANKKGFYHNDLVSPNLLLTAKENGMLGIKAVDFNLASDGSAIPECVTKELQSRNHKEVTDVTRLDELMEFYCGG